MRRHQLTYWLTAVPLPMCSCSASQRFGTWVSRFSSATRATFHGADLRSPCAAVAVLPARRRPSARRSAQACARISRTPWASPTNPPCRKPTSEKRRISRKTNRRLLRSIKLRKVLIFDSDQNRLLLGHELAAPSCNIRQAPDWHVLPLDWRNRSVTTVAVNGIVGA